MPSESAATPSRPNTVNPVAYCYVRVEPRAHEDAFHKWLDAQLSRMPYLSKGLVRLAICHLLAPDLSKTFDTLTRECYLDGWQRGYKDGLRVAKESQGG